MDDMEGNEINEVKCTLHARRSPSPSREDEVDDNSAGGGILRLFSILKLCVESIYWGFL